MAEEEHLIVVAGGGPAGLTAAYQLTQNGRECLVVEAGPEVGGMCRSLSLWGQTVDLGPHRFFTTDPIIERIWKEVLGGEFHLVKRVTRIFYLGRFFDYPLRLGNVFNGLGIRESARCFLSYLKSRIFSRSGITFEDWVVARFGRHLFEIFFKAYSEKLWGLVCGELHADFAAQRIQGLSFLEAVKRAVGWRTGHRTLADCFFYPNKGTGEVYRRMRMEIEKNGGKVRLNLPIQKIILREGSVEGVRFANGEDVRCKHLISSIPLTQLITMFEPEPPATVLEAAAKLLFRSTVIIYLKFDGPAPFPDQWIYVHDPEVAVGRITNYSNWGGVGVLPSAQTILSFEYWCGQEDRAWHRTDAEWIALARSEFKKMGSSLWPNPPLISGEFVYRIPFCYPVYSTDYKMNLAPVIEYLRTVRNLLVIGRPGAFKYNNQDHSLLMGWLAARRIQEGIDIDLWSVNTGSSYQETGRLRIPTY